MRANRNQAVQSSRRRKRTRDRAGAWRGKIGGNHGERDEMRRARGQPGPRRVDDGDRDAGVHGGEPEQGVRRHRAARQARRMDRAKQRRRLAQKGLAPMAAAGPRGHLRPEEAQVQLVQGGDRGRPGEPRRARLPRRRPQQALAHRRDAVPDPGRQGVPESRDRLLRRDAGRLDDKGAARRRDGQHDARGGVAQRSGRARPP